MPLPSARMPFDMQMACGLSSRRGQEQNDFGFSENLCFDDFYTLYRRNSMARAVVERIPERCWESVPEIIEGDNPEDSHDKTVFESAVEKLFSELSIWERMKAADCRGRVGSYGALYLMFGDGISPEEPVGRGAKLLKVQPLFECQLRPVEFDEDITSIRYGQPTVFQFVPNSENSNLSRQQSMPHIHHSRVVIFAEGSDDGGIAGSSALEPVYNDLLTLERIIGACGVGYWRTARSGLTIKAGSGEADIIGGLAASMGCEPSEVADRLDGAVYDFVQGLSTSLMVGGLDVQQLDFTLPDPEPFARVARMSIAAGSKTPEPILVGQQLSQKASDKNSEEFDRTCESRRPGFLTPVIRHTINHLMEVGALPNVERYCVYWPELASPSQDDKIALASKMADVNSKSAQNLGESPFTLDELRSAAGYEPLEELDYEEGEAQGSNEAKEP